MRPRKRTFSVFPVSAVPASTRWAPRLVGVLTALIATIAAPLVARGDNEAFRTAIALQICLERAGFSPGLIDGKPGPRTELALREFQRSAGLAVTAALDNATMTALGVDPYMALTTHVVGPADLDRIAPLPPTWPEKSKATHLGYESAVAALAEKFHCSRELLSRLNPGVDMDRVALGQSLVVPNVSAAPRIENAHALEIDTTARTIRARNRDGKVVGLFHCSVAAKKAKLPSGRAVVNEVTFQPTYRFDPRMWPEVKGVDRVLMIPPGPRNPVGLCWIDLSLPGYGIHGTPNPELIGKTGSHGCIRLTNWDAVRLGQSIRQGTTVRFVTDAVADVRSARR